MKRKLWILMLAILFFPTRIFAAGFYWGDVTTRIDGTLFNSATDQREARVYLSVMSYQNIKVNTPLIIPGNSRSATITFSKRFYVAVTVVSNEGYESGLSQLAFYIKGDVNDTDVTTARVDIGDIQVMSANFGQTVPAGRWFYSSQPGEPGFTEKDRCDINGDTDINFFDQAEVGLNYGAATE